MEQYPGCGIIMEGVTQTMLKDYWGNDAIDFGEISTLWEKYSDKVFVSVTNKPFGDSYVLFICNSGEEKIAKAYMADYCAKMESKGITAYGIGVSHGYTLQSVMLERFQWETRLFENSSD